MDSLKPVNRKARKVEETIAAATGDVHALQDQKSAPARVYYPMGCTLNFTPGWEVDVSGGTAGLCQPVERDLFDCYLGCGWPAQVPDHLNNSPEWTDKCSSAANDWRKVDVVFP
jgi:Quinohemoprotein amine dehydrogenase, gamma subunit